MISLEQERRLIEIRRSKVLEMAAKGFNQTEISHELNVTETTISRDIKHLRTQAKENIRNYIDNELPAEYNKTLAGITSILKEAWITANKAAVSKDRIQALSLAKDCYNMKLELLTNASVVEEAVKFVEAKKKEKEPEPSNNEDKDIIDSEEPVPIEEEEDLQES